MTVEQALAGMSPLQREILVSLLKGEESADDTLARRYGISVSDVRTQRFLACDRMRRLLREGGPRLEAGRRSA